MARNPCSASHGTRWADEARREAALGDHVRGGRVGADSRDEQVGTAPLAHLAEQARPGAGPGRSPPRPICTAREHQSPTGGPRNASLSCVPRRCRSHNP
eukprot:15457082-Alexandrium_andersonii.AAC.1